MSHPYSGAASYIYANEYLAEDDIPPRSSFYRDNEWIAAVQPSSAPATTSRAHHRFSRQRSAPHLPPSSFRSEHYRTFSASTYATSAPANSVQPSYTYESMRVRFDTPSPHIMAWRRQVKVMKNRVQRFRERLSEFLMPRWITSPHPRLSMVR